jgi:hypothetical protein
MICGVNVKVGDKKMNLCIKNNLMNIFLDFKRGEDRRSYGQSRFPGPGGPRGGRGGPILNYAPRGGGPMFRGGRVQGKYNNPKKVK